MCFLGLPRFERDASGCEDPPIWLPQTTLLLVEKTIPHCKLIVLIYAVVIP